MDGWNVDVINRHTGKKVWTRHFRVKRRSGSVFNVYDPKLGLAKVDDVPMSEEDSDELVAWADQEGIVHVVADADGEVALPADLLSAMEGYVRG